jgi:hypothetical protein
VLLKLALVVVVVAATGAGLLTVRQQRLEAVHNMAKALDHAAMLEREVWRLRIEAARLTSPLHAQGLLVRLGETRPVVVPWCPTFAPLAFDPPALQHADASTPSAGPM